MQTLLRLTSLGLRVSIDDVGDLIQHAESAYSRYESFLKVERAKPLKISPKHKGMRRDEPGRKCFGKLAYRRGGNHRKRYIYIYIMNSDASHPRVLYHIQNILQYRYTQSYYHPIIVIRFDPPAAIPDAGGQRETLPRCSSSILGSQSGNFLRR